MKIAIEGCCHGELDKVYEILSRVEAEKGYKIDLLICCGDFQSVRNSEDLSCMAVPMKYRYMQSFYKYYSGEKKAPIFTIFIGGNHEASNYLWELSYGGWVAPNIFYMGNAGVVKYGGLRIAGLSGIYKPFDYEKNHFECPPYNSNTVRSAYHVRSCDVFRLLQLSGKIDIGLSHDWPLGIHEYGDKDLLLRLKPFFNEEMSSNTLGSPPAMELLKHFRPDYWFSGHLHVKFAAVYRHPDTQSTEQTQQATGEETSAEEEPMESQSEGRKEEEEVMEKKEEPGVAEEQIKSEEEVGEEKKESQEESESAETEKIEDGTQSGNEAAKEGVGLDAGSSEADKNSSMGETETVSAEDGGGDEHSQAVSNSSTGGGEEVKTSAAEAVEDPPASDSMISSSTSATGEKLEDNSAGVNTASLGKYTKFLALDKVMPRKRFLQILDLEPSDDVKMEAPYRLEYDAEWLAILKSTEHLMKYKEEPLWAPPTAPDSDRTTFTPTEEELLDVQQRFSQDGCDSHLYVADNFSVTVPAYVENQQVDYSAIPKAQENPQTVQFCEKLGIENPFTPTVFGVVGAAPANPEEINVDEEHHGHDGHDGEENVSEEAVTASRPALVLPPPSNTQSSDPVASGNGDSAAAPAESAVADTTPGESAVADDDTKQENGEGGADTELDDSQEDSSKSQSLKRSLSDRSPDRLKPQEEAVKAEDESAENEGNEGRKLEDEPLIKRRNVDIYKEDSAEVDE